MPEEEKTEQEKSPEEDEPYVYVDGKKEMKDGSGMVKESCYEEAE